MLPKVQKLKLDQEFNQVFKTGRSIYGRFLGVKVIKNNLKYSRFGIILGTKIEKSAVKRHFIKRMIYRLIEDNKRSVAFPCDCVIIALPKIKEASFIEIKTDFLEILRKIFLNKAL